jgi:hypothetical protein
MYEGVEIVTNCITRSEIIENLYVRYQASSNASLEQAIVSLYSSILRYLGTALRYYGQNTGGKCKKHVATLNLS